MQHFPNSNDTSAIGLLVLEIFVFKRFNRRTHERKRAIYILTCDENAPPFKCAWLWPIKSFAQMCYVYLLSRKKLMQRFRTKNQFERLH